MEDREEDLLGHVLGLAGIAKPAQREAVHARKIGFVQEIEVRATTRQDLGNELAVARPGTRRLRHDSPLRLRRSENERGGGSPSESGRFHASAGSKTLRAMP